jgi:integrase
LRKTFYRAQVRAGLCEEPATSEKGYEQWDDVDVHTLHDCRHTFAVCRGLGLDGEPTQGNEYLANQLGHVDEVMVNRVYKNLSPARRRQLLAEAEKMRRAS